MVVKSGSDRVGALAERQAARWERERRAAAKARLRPAVAISRLPGSGGHEVAQRVAEALDFGLFGREIVEEVAREEGVDHWLVDGLDEHVQSGIERSLDELAGRSGIDGDRFQRKVARAVTTLGRRGSVVIVGRGAPFLLGEHDALRVLLVAPRAQREERWAKLEGLAPDQAGSALDVAERRRAEYARHCFGVDHTDPTRYELAVDTHAFGISGAADLIVEAYGRRFPA
jgi:cytidylate kinase